MFVGQVEDQMKLLQSSWSEILILDFVYRQVQEHWGTELLLVSVSVCVCVCVCVFCKEYNNYVYVTFLRFCVGTHFEDCVMHRLLTLVCEILHYRNDRCCCYYC